MTVIVANKIPNKIKGCLKTWFIEPKNNVFVANINNTLALRIIQFVNQYSTKNSSYIIIQTTNNSVGYKIFSIGNTSKELIDLSGLQCLS